MTEFAAGGLRGVRVLDLSGTLGPAYCSLLLAQCGASVTVVEPDAGHPMRTRRPAGAERAGVLFDHLSVGKSLVPPNAQPSWTDVDMVIVDDTSSVDATEIADRDPRLVVVSFSAYGLRGPYAGRAGNDLTAQADSGSLLVRGLPTDPPVMMGGDLVEWTSGAYGAAAAVATWFATRTTGIGDLIDVSLCEAALVTGSLFAGLLDVFRGSPERIGPARTVESPSIEPTADGWIGVTTNTPAQFDGFLDAIGRADLIGDARFNGPAQRIANWAEWCELVHAATRAFSSADLLERLLERRVPSAIVNDGSAVLSLDQATARGAYVEAPDGTYRRPREPWRVRGFGVSAEPQQRTRPVPELPLAGLRVLDLTAWWAGPSSTQLLAAFGADVIHVEAPSRPDGMRMTGLAAAPHERWYDRAFFFHQINPNKRSLVVDASVEEGRRVLLDLVADADVLVENFTPRVLESFGLDVDDVRAVNPRLVLTRLPAFGLDGPWRDQPGFAQTMEQITGMAWVTGHVADQPRVPRGPCDPNGGLHGAIATLVALLDVERTGEGRLVEASLFDAALAIGAEQVVENTANGLVLQRNGNRSPHHAPQGVYRSAGESEVWVAISCTGDGPWSALCAVVPGLDTWRAADVDARRAAHDAIDEVVGAWCAERSPEDAADVLASLGVCAAVGRDPRDASGHPQMVARGFFEGVDVVGLGVVPVPTMPFRSRRVERWIRTPAPSFGAHNDEILAAAGRDADAVAALVTAGVVSDRPRF